MSPDLFSFLVFPVKLQKGLFGTFIYLYDLIEIANSGHLLYIQILMFYLFCAIAISESHTCKIAHASKQFSMIELDRKTSTLKIFKTYFYINFVVKPIVESDFWSNFPVQALFQSSVQILEVWKRHYRNGFPTNSFSCFS